MEKKKYRTAGVAGTGGEILPDRKLAPLNLGNVLVLGLGKTGMAAAKYCANLLGGRVESLAVYGGKTPDSAEVLEFVRALEGAGVSFVFDSEEVSGTFDLCIASPGISQFSSFYESAQSHAAEIISEIEFAWRESAANSIWVAITGTNGKTTTTSLTAHILESAGLHTNCVGNIGSVALQAVERECAQDAAGAEVAGAAKEQDAAGAGVEGAGAEGALSAGSADAEGEQTSQDVPTIYVAEVSSYQLASTKYFAPDVAVLLNITPDHLHWHKTMSEYVSAKLKLFANMGEQSGARSHVDASQDAGAGLGIETGAGPCAEAPANFMLQRVAILDATDSTVRQTVRAFKAIPEDKRGFSYVPIGTAAGYFESMHARCGAKNAAYIEAAASSAVSAGVAEGVGTNAGGTLKVLFNSEAHTYTQTKDLQIKGCHNYANALAAASAALAIAQNTTNAALRAALTDSSITNALKTFKPLEHRIEPCGNIGGIECYNDSKATNVDATLVALDSFPAKKLVVLLGGLDKDTPLEPLVERAHAQAHHVVCFGQAAPRFSQAFKDAGYNDMLEMANNLEEALDAALTLAHAGDVILLSPACASFDEFRSFEHRGKMFKKFVSDRM